MKPRAYTVFLSLGLAGCVLLSRCGNQSGSPGGSTLCGFSVATGSTHCGCNFQSPVSLSANPTMQFWPFGVHAASGHTEGHRGLDFIVQASTPSGALPQVPVYSPEDGTIINIDNAQDQSGKAEGEFAANPLNHFTKLHLDCNVNVVFIPLTLLQSIVDGMAATPSGVRVKKGDQLGYLPQTKNASPCPSDLAHNCPTVSTHYEVDVNSENDPAQYAVCPALFLSSADQATVQTMVASVPHYTEYSARTVSVTCDDASTISQSYPAETQSCNVRLSQQPNGSALYNSLAACTKGKASWIW